MQLICSAHRRVDEESYTQVTMCISLFDWFIVNSDRQCTGRHVCDRITIETVFVVLTVRCHSLNQQEITSAASWSLAWSALAVGDDTNAKVSSANKLMSQTEALGSCYVVDINRKQQRTENCTLRNSRVDFRWWRNAAVDHSNMVAIFEETFKPF